MSSASQGAVAFAPVENETTPSAVARSNSSLTGSARSVLLVGRHSSWGTQITKSLRDFGSSLSFASPADIKPVRDQRVSFDLILLDSTVTPEDRRRLAAALLGSRTSIYYTFPVENGCWWLPALRYGRDCHGTAAFRRREFSSELENVLRHSDEARELAG